MVLFAQKMVKVSQVQVTKYSLLVEALKNEILGGKYHLNKPFPSIRALIRRFNLSDTTVQRALDELFHQGLISRKQGRGTFITSNVASRKIGLIVPGVANSEFFPKLVGEISRFLGDREYTLIYEDINADGKRLSWDVVYRSVMRLIAENVSGVLFHPFPDEGGKINQRVMALLSSARIPVVSLSRNVEGVLDKKCIDCVGIDNIGAGRQVGEYLIGCGCKRIAFLLYPDVTTVRDRMWGLLISVQGTPVRFKSYKTRLDDARTIKMMMASFHPHAIVCGNDELAVAVKRSLDELKICVPEDVKLLGFDDIRYAQSMVPQLTSVRQPCTEIALTAVNRLIERIKTPDLPQMSMRLQAEIIVRGSTSSKTKSQKSKRQTT